MTQYTHTFQIVLERIFDSSFRDSVGEKEVHLRVPKNIAFLDVECLQTIVEGLRTQYLFEIRGLSNKVEDTEEVEMVLYFAMNNDTVPVEYELINHLGITIAPDNGPTFFVFGRELEDEVVEDPTPYFTIDWEYGNPVISVSDEKNTNSMPYDQLRYVMIDHYRTELEYWEQDAQSENAHEFIDKY